MGAAKENRDRAAIISRIESEASEPCGMTRRGLSEYITGTENHIEALKAKVSSQADELTRARALIERQRVYLKHERTERAKAEKEAARGWEWVRLWSKAFKRKERAHIKLSKVVRLALTPEQYHQARELIEG